MKALKIALQLLTPWPVSIEGTVERQQYGQALLFYPLVGVVLAVPLFGLAQAGYVLPEDLLAVLILLLWVVITGGIHLSNFAEVVEAFIAGNGDRSRTFRLLQEQPTGTVGVCAIVLLLLLKFACLQYVLQQQWLLQLEILAFTLLLARLSVVFLFVKLEYIRKIGLGFTISENLDKGLARNLVLGLMLACVMIGWFTGLMAVLGAVFAWLLVFQLSKTVLQGFTGKIAGACIEWVEVSVLFFSVVGLSLLQLQ